ncbi:MAG: ADP-dependent glucokinase/phosphofructokinase [Candidatus Micrarchaeota archaeon]|nr:ADP-dependent glucokinase/phosphofructokinase [Candidatus Micrarchaeota archaeon]
MRLPKSAIFAFNCNPDYIKIVSKNDLETVKSASKSLFYAMKDCFSTGAQREVRISRRLAKKLQNLFVFDKKTIGGQAGNAAQQASLLGVTCFLHTTNFGSDFFLLFEKPSKILVASSSGFLPADQFTFKRQSSAHFVFEYPKKNTRFIASFDAAPLSLERSFCKFITPIIPDIPKAFVGGVHLLSSVSQLAAFVSEIKRWKKHNPEIEVFLELGEFSNRKIIDFAEKKLFPCVDCVGLNEVEAKQLSLSVEEISRLAGKVLFHSPKRQFVLPSSPSDQKALLFAKKCASFKAKTGRFATLSELSCFRPLFVKHPKMTVGLGDVFSSAYFLSS